MHREADRYLNGRKCVRESQGQVKTSQQRGCRDSREMALPEVVPKNGNMAPWKEGFCGQCRGKHLGRLGLAQRTPRNPGNTILGLSLLPAPLWHLSVVLYILSPTRHLLRSCYVCVFPHCSLWVFIQHIIYSFRHSNSFWCI